MYLLPAAETVLAATAIFNFRNFNRYIADKAVNANQRFAGWRQRLQAAVFTFLRWWGGSFVAGVVDVLTRRRLLDAAALHLWRLVTTQSSCHVNTAAVRARSLSDRQGVDISFTVFCLFVILCGCAVTDFSGKDKASGVKFCTAVHRRFEQGISHFGELCFPRSGRIGARWVDVRSAWITASPLHQRYLLPVNSLTESRFYVSLDAEYVISRTFLPANLLAWYLRWWRHGYSVGLAINRSWVQILLGAKLRNNLGQVVHTYVLLSPSSINWYRPRGGDALRLGR